MVINMDWDEAIEQAKENLDYNITGYIADWSEVVDIKR